LYHTASFAPHFASRNLLPQLFEATVIVVPCIANGLAQLGGNLLERVPFEEKQVERLTLTF
jgi:hypothetical protein